MAPTNDDRKKPDDELIELHTGDVQPLPATPTPNAKPFDAEETLPYPGGKPYDPDVTDPLGKNPRPKPPPPVAPARLFEDMPFVPDGDQPLSNIESSPPPVRHGLDPAFLCVARGPGSGTSVSIPEGEHHIGRSPACFLAIAHDSISREHALLKRSGDRFFVRDAGSQTGTFVNGRLVEGTREVFAGDEIQIGEAALYLRTGPVTDPFLTAPGIDDRILHRRGSALFWVGVAATALASAALAAVLLTPLRERIFRHLPQVTVAAPASAPAPGPEPAEPVPDLDPGPSDITIDGDIEIKRAIRDFVPEEPAPDPNAPASPRPVAEPRPHPANPAAAMTEGLRLFNDGQVDQAIVAARNGGAMHLAMRIWAFRKEVRTAQADVSVQNVTGAIHHYGAAVALDEQLTRGWSKPGAEARSELTRLLVQAGEKALTQKNPAQACGLLEKALVYQPGNARAEELLKTARMQRAAGVVPSGEDLKAEPPPPAEPQPKAEPAPEAKPETKPEPEPKPETKPEPRPEPKPKPKAEARPKADPKPKAEPKKDPRSTAADEAFGN